MQILPVSDRKSAAVFLHLPVQIYKDDASWIRPLDKDILDVFDPQKNKAFRFGKLSRWIVVDEHNLPLGRIAAFVNKKYKNKGDDVPVGGIGFFECINHQQTANLLFDSARHWLADNGMEAMDGPINFGERNNWWGLVTEGFHSPLYGMNYNPPYYKDLFEKYGFQPFYEQLCMGMNPQEKIQDKILHKYLSIKQTPGYSCKPFKRKQIRSLAADFSEVYNSAWAGHDGMKTISKDQALIFFKKMQRVVDEKAICFAYYNEKPIGFFVNLPDLNQWFKYLKGKWNFLQKFYFLWLKKTKTNRKLTGIVFGVIPEFQGKGIDSFMIGSVAENIQNGQSAYTEYELQWIGDFNPKMLNLAKGLGNVNISRKLTTYRYLFDSSKPFKKHPIISELRR
ncbi:MAG: hypothetical protein FGM46_06760 [Ferruginibacter sp.]|nr:hypothetical protein [Ferruginibacter sp.]